MAVRRAPLELIDSGTVHSRGGALLANSMSTWGGVRARTRVWVWVRARARVRARGEGYR